MSSPFPARSRMISSGSSASTANSSARSAAISLAAPEHTASLRSRVVRPERTSSYNSELIGTSHGRFHIASRESNSSRVARPPEGGNCLAVKLERNRSRVVRAYVDSVSR